MADPFHLITARDFPDPVQPELRLRQTHEDTIDEAIALDVAKWLTDKISGASADRYQFVTPGKIQKPFATALALFRRSLFQYGIPLLYGLEFTKSLTHQLFGRDVRLGVAGNPRRGRRFLILGERGSGKERIAEVIGRTLCAMSDRAGDWQRYNAAAFHAQTLMSTLFGHVKGAYTGATRDRPGVFERLDGGGAVFLDEIGDIPVELQVALLRILETGEFHRLGAEERAPMSADFHLVAATNRRRDELREGDVLRADLVDRLARHTVHVPSLRQVLARHGNPHALFEHLLAFTYEELGLSWRVAESLQPRAQLARRITGASTGYRWPGNLREVASVLRELVWLGEPALARFSEVPEQARPQARPQARQEQTPTPVSPAAADDGLATTDIAWGKPRALDRALENNARTHYLRACQRARTINEVAELLGVSRQRAARDLRKYDLSVG